MLVVADHPATRAALIEMLASTSDLILAGTATDGCRGIALVERVEPDLVLVSMPVTSAIEATRRLVESRPDTRVLVLSAEVRWDVVRAAREAGAAGFVRKGCRESEFIRAIGSVLAGRPVWPTPLP